MANDTIVFYSNPAFRDELSDLVREGARRMIDHAAIPNFANIEPTFREAAFDPGRRDSVPYMWSTMGIGYRKSRVDGVPDSWRWLYESDRYNGPCALLNDANAVLGAAFKYMGHPLNTADPGIVGAAEELIIAHIWERTPRGSTRRRGPGSRPRDGAALAHVRGGARCRGSPKSRRTTPCPVHPSSCIHPKNRRKFPLSHENTSVMAENVFELPLTPRMADRLLREAVEDSSKLVNTMSYVPAEAWYELVSNRQAILCLKEGRVVETPSKDEHGNWIAVSYRLCGGSDVYVTSAIELNDDGTIRTVYILKMDNRLRL